MHDATRMRVLIHRT